MQDSVASIAETEAEQATAAAAATAAVENYIEHRACEADTDILKVWWER